LLALDEFWERDLDHREPVIKIFPVLFFRDHCPYRPICRRDHSNIYLARFKCPHTLYFLCLKYAHQFGLLSERHVADFMPAKQRAIGIFEQTYFVVCRTGEGSSLVTEQFALEKCLDYCGRITHSKRTSLRGAQLMQSPSDEFFAGSSLPGNEHRPKV